MNASFEDCIKLCDLIKKNDNWESVFSKFNQTRKVDADAISNLALKNYKIMRDNVLDENYVLKNKISFKLLNIYPEYFIPEYIMVSFTNIPYSTVQKRSHIQDKILDNIIARHDIKNLQDKAVTELIKTNLDKINYA